jgi:predicted O-methyltransferase YrrM
MLTPEVAIKSGPHWIHRQVNELEATALVREIRTRRVAAGIEIGVASGYSSTAISLTKSSP